MITGRKPKPTHLKLITGNPGGRKLNRAEPRPGPLLPDAPAELSKDGLTEWKRVARRLLAAGMLTAIDRGVLAAYCQAYGRWVLAERILAELARRNPGTGGLLIKTSNGNTIQNPIVGTANKAMSDMVRYAAELGMTPSARSRVRLDDEHDDDPAGFFDR
jgi:P27 family predicted phage terminase small subunit